MLIVDFLSLYVLTRPRHRYTYLQGRTSPFNYGVAANVKEFFWPKRNWAAVFRSSLDDVSVHKA
jgi:hypothetical protein